MSIIYVLLAISVIVALIFFVAFILSIKNGQYDDTYTPSIRMLFEDELVNESERPTVSPTETKSINLNTKQ